MARFGRALVCVSAVVLGLASATFAAKPEKQTLPEPQAHLRLEQRAGYWVMEVSNTGEEPLRIVADARLLRLEITTVPSSSASTDDPSKKKKAPKKTEPKTIVCELPASMRSPARTLTLAPSARYVEPFDPRLLCLDRARELVIGASVEGKLGWPTPKVGKVAAPFVVAPMPGPSASSKPTLASEKELVAASVVVENKAKTTGTSTSSVVVKITQPKPLLSLVAHPGAARSAYDGGHASVTIVVRNESDEPHSVYARAHLISAIVRGPRGQVVRCAGYPLAPAPIADFVTKLSPNGSWSATVELSEICPSDTFDTPGLYEVTPVLHAPPLPKVTNAISGDLVSDAPQLLRIETGPKPFHDAEPFALLTSE